MFTVPNDPGPYDALRSQLLVSSSRILFPPVPDPLLWTSSLLLTKEIYNS
jgi:hypothetical protein